jgi:hypothetical protein
VVIRLHPEFSQSGHPLAPRVHSECTPHLLTTARLRERMAPNSSRLRTSSVARSAPDEGDTQKQSACNQCAMRGNQHAPSVQCEAISMHAEAHAPIRAMPSGPCSCAGVDADLSGDADLANPGRTPLSRLSKAELSPDRISRASRQTARAACCAAGSGASGTRRTEKPLLDETSTPSAL